MKNQKTEYQKEVDALIKKSKRKRKSPRVIPISKDKETQKLYKKLTDFMARELKGL